MILEETYELSNGVKIPKVGFGTWLIQGDAATKATKDAIDCGYRLIDTAQAYGNEAEVGKGIRESGIARDEIFVASKIAAELKTKDAAATSIDETLKKMELDHLDLMIIHSPQPWSDFRTTDERFFEGNLEAWSALEDAYKAGKLRSIGVSNFDKIDMKNIMDNANIDPMVNQILCHVGHTPQGTIQYCQEHKILVEGYSPIAHGQASRLSGVKAIAEKYGVTVPQLCIRYLIELGIVPLPKASKAEHIADNAKVDFKIDAGDMEFLKDVAPLPDYGEEHAFPVFSQAKID